MLQFGEFSRGFALEVRRISPKTVDVTFRSSPKMHTGWLAVGVSPRRQARRRAGPGGALAPRGEVVEQPHPGHEVPPVPRRSVRRGAGRLSDYM